MSIRASAARELRGDSVTPAAAREAMRRKSRREGGCIAAPYGTGRDSSPLARRGARNGEGGMRRIRGEKALDDGCTLEGGAVPGAEPSGALVGAVDERGDRRGGIRGGAHGLVRQDELAHLGMIVRGGRRDLRLVESGRL